jgi:hypothetical protein
MCLAMDWICSTRKLPEIRFANLIFSVVLQMSSVAGLFGIIRGHSRCPTYAIRKMNPLRQIETAELLINANNFSVVRVGHIDRNTTGPVDHPADAKEIEGYDGRGHSAN